MKRISEAERKCRERNARINGSSPVSSTLTCTSCNRHFRAKIGIVSRQKKSPAHVNNLNSQEIKVIYKPVVFISGT